MRHSLAFILTALSFNFPGIAVASADLPPQAGKPQLGTFGIDTKAMDPAVKPGDDFNRHANGSWLKGDHIPADRPRFGSFDILAKQAEERTRAILEEAASARPAPGSVHRKIGDFYASFMNEAHVESLGKAPIEPELKRIGAIQSRDDVQSYLIHAANAGLQLPIGVTIWPDQKNADQYAVMIYQSGLGMPDRDYYLSDEPRLALARAKYLDYIAKLFALAGIEGGEAKAKGVFEFEKSIAEKHWTRAESRDASKTYNPHTVSELETMAPQIAWARFMSATRLDVRPVYVVRQTTAVAATAKLLAEAPIATLRDYFAFHAIADAAPYLGKAFVDARFDFVGRTLQGTPELAPRWRRAVIATNAAMNEGIGQVWVQRHFPPESKARMERLVANLKLAMGKRIDGLDWMSEDTKKQAHAKLGTFVTKIGYPDKWRDYSKLEVRGNDLFGNVRRGRVFELDRNRDRLGKPTDRKEWYMGPQEVNAYYNPVFNEIVFPAAILQPPFFDPAADDAVNYGGIGAVIGHEIGHGFDDQGRKYDAKGALRDWWTAEDDRRFRERSDRLVAQYGSYCPLPPTGCINGRLALGENVGDLGGLQMAHEAYRLSLQGGKAPVIAGYTGDQRFFLSFGQIWRTQMRDPFLRNQLTVGPHSPDPYRINGVVRNIDAWYAAFGVEPGEKLYLPPEERVRIW